VCGYEYAVITVGNAGGVRRLADSTAPKQTDTYEVVEITGKNGLIRLHIPTDNPGKDREHFLNVIAEVALKNAKRKVKIETAQT
jgi:hypothetical protein